MDLAQAKDQIEAWSRRANEGDTEAAAQVLSACLPYWVGSARQIMAGHTGEDAADLAQDAITKLLVLWRRGEGPESNTRAYVTAMMRNAHLDRLRSPRSKVDSLEQIEDLLGQPALIEPNGADHLELTRETDAVRRALDTLSSDYRTVLVATVVEGRKPAELVEVLDRPAPAISNLLNRAKHALHRALLIDHLAQGQTECASNAEQLPKRVLLDYEQHAETDGGLEHVRGCEHCRRNWRRFAAIVSALGVLPLLTIAQLTAGPSPAAADTGDGGGDGEHGGEGSASSAAGSAFAASAGAAGSGSVGVASVATVSASAGFSASASAGVAAGGSATAASAAVRPMISALASTATLSVSIVLLVIAGLAFLSYSLLAATQQRDFVYEGEIAGVNPHGAAFEVVLDVAEPGGSGEGVGGGLDSITIEFSVSEAEQWSVTEIVLSLSRGTTVALASNGLSCEPAGSALRCVTTEATDVAGPFVFTTESTVPNGQFGLALAAETTDDSFSGAAEGRW